VTGDDRLEPDRLAADNKMAQLFGASAAPVELRLASFPAFVRHRYLARFLGLYEIFRRIVTVKGSVVECGVFQGGSLLAWAKLARILDPSNARRRVYGFDTFTGFPQAGSAAEMAGQFATAGGFSEVRRLIDAFQHNELPDESDMITLIPGDAVQTIPDFVAKHPHLVVALLFLDFDLYEPTAVALRHFLPRMPRGAVIAFDELDDPCWPGESQAVIDEIGLRHLRLRRVPFDATVGYAVLD
jgi:hypothetical protein